MTRRRYRFNETTKEMEEIALDAPVTPRLQLATGALYEGVRALDGTDIGSRRKHAEYMKRNNLAPADDFKRTWAEEPKKREAEARAQRREAIGRTIHQLETRGRR